MNIVVNSRFNPFTYEQLVKPLEDYTKAYKEVEDQYAGLLEQTEAFRDIATRENNPESYSMFNKYATDLRTVTDDFSKGMTLANRRQLLNLKRRYAKEIAPIARADAARQDALKYRRDVRARDNSAMFRVEDPSVDDYLHGNTVSDDYISGKDILARTSAKSEALGKALFSDPEFISILGGQQYQVIQQNGMTPEALNLVINDQLNNPNISDELRTKLQGFRGIIDDELNSVSNWGNDVKQQVLNNVTTGIYAGLAKPTYNYVANSEYKNAAQRQSLANQAAELRISERQLEMQTERYEVANGTRPYYTAPDGTEYYSNGTMQWTESPSRQGSNEAATYTVPTPIRNNRRGAANTPTGSLPNLYWHANNDSASNVNSVSSSTNYTRADADEIISPLSLSDAQQDQIKDALAGSAGTWTIDDVLVGVIRHRASDDEYFLIPNSAAISQRQTAPVNNQATTEDPNEMAFGEDE